MANRGGSNVGIRAIPFLNHPAYDAFGRLRSGEPFTIFDSKLIHDKATLFWDEATVSGGGMSSTYLSNEAAVEIESTDATAGHFVRQTKMRFNYQPGKSQRIFMTGVLNSGGGGTGVTSRIGYMDQSNGIFFQLQDGQFSVGVRSNASGTPVDTIIPSNQFNGDQFPDSMGIGFNELKIDFTKTQIFAINFEWLGVGSVIYSMFQDATEYILHVEHHANILDEVYMSTPNLPLRYELITTAASVASKMKHICSTVISEGGQNQTGVLRYYSTGQNTVQANSTNNIYAAIGVRLKSTHLDATVKQIRASLLATTNDDLEWVILLNPTLTSASTWLPQDDSAVEIARETSNVVTDFGYALDGGHLNGDNQVNVTLFNSINLGSTIDGTSDEVWLCVRPFSNGLDFYAGITWREFL